MKNPRAKLPFAYKVVNGLGWLLQAANLPIMRLDEETVSASARKQTGLTDFGHPHYRPGLLRFLESAEEDANLHPLGRFMAHDFVTNYLVQRLRLVEARNKEPEIFQRALLPPLIVIGLARSGTTFLHRMLALDPAHRALPQWLLVRPFPEKENGRTPDPRIVKMEQAIRFRRPLLLDLDAIHHTDAHSPEECMFMLGLTFRSLIFPALSPVYGYLEWYLEQDDASQKYQEYRWLLQVFQSHEPEQRLTLKAPAHTGNLEALFTAIPEAMIIQTHRDPVPCVSSLNSLLYTVHQAVAKEIDVRRMSELVLRLYENWLRRNLAARAAQPGAVYDVDYDALVADPMGTVRGIYAHFDLPWTDSFASKLQDFVQTNPKDRHGKHTYAASDFGQTDDEITERLRFYSEHFGLGTAAKP